MRRFSGKERTNLHCHVTHGFHHVRINVIKLILEADGRRHSVCIDRRSRRGSSRKRRIKRRHDCTQSIIHKEISRHNRRAESRERVHFQFRIQHLGAQRRRGLCDGRRIMRELAREHVLVATGWRGDCDFFVKGRLASIRPGCTRIFLGEASRRHGSDRVLEGLNSCSTNSISQVPHRWSE